MSKIINKKLDEFEEEVSNLIKELDLKGLSKEEIISELEKNKIEACKGGCGCFYRFIDNSSGFCDGDDRIEVYYESYTLVYFDDGWCEGIEETIL